MNFADLDPALRPLLDRYLEPEDRKRIEPVIAELGEIAAGELDRLAATADRNPPTLKQYSPAGERIDEVEFHPAYERMLEIGLGRFGLAALSNRGGVHGWEAPAPHLVKHALSYVFTQSEFGIGCPINMTDSAARVLRMFDPERYATEIAALTSAEAPYATGAMFMTELDAGSDLAQTATVATDHGDHWTLSGRKWFCSNVSADVILTLGVVPGQGEGTRGLGMFLMPRLRPDGTRNSYRIDRLKDKLGTKSMASGEVTLLDAYALPVGDLTRGVQQMMEMVNHSRVSNVMRAAALMRRSVNEAVAHTLQRKAFGRALFDQPLMRRTLLGLIIEAEAALGMLFETSARLAEGDAGDERAHAVARILTPIAKYTVCKRARWVTGEAMEVRGGNGYIEDWVNPRLLRDAHLGSIWEGSSNVIALDVLRCMRKERSHLALHEAYRDLGGDPELAAHWDRLRDRGEEILTLPPDEQELRIGDHAGDLCRAVQATLLLDQAAYESAHGHGPRKTLVAEAFRDDLLAPGSVPAEALRRLDLIANVTR